MYFWISIAVCAIGFVLWIRYELKNAIVIEDDDEDEVFTMIRTALKNKYDKKSEEELERQKNETK